MASTAPSDRPPVFINLDETSVMRHVTGLRGTVAKFSCREQKAVDRVSLADRRSNISLLGCVTSEVEIQKLLPQVLLGNHHQFTLQLLNSITSGLPTNISLWREASSWNTHATMRKWLSHLLKALGSWVDKRTIILLLDVHPSHIHPSIWQHARRCRIRLLYIPSRMTGHLQPLDTHVYSQFKAAMRRGWQTRKAQIPDGRVSHECWLQIVCEVVSKVLISKSWRHAFLADGILDSQRSLSKTLLAELGFQSEAPHFGNEAPTATEAACIFPMRMKLDIEGYVLWKSKAERSKGARASASIVSPDTFVPFKRRILPPSFQAASASKRIRTLD